ncbi:MAG: L,D-transpeptidase [Anaerolineales bacterium]|nr:L,D-transpeptidase [Anaerolineales bacterium]
MTFITRKNFLKLSLLGFLGAGFSPGFSLPGTRMTRGIIGRVAADNKVIYIYEEPDYDSEIVRRTSFDELLHLYYELEIEDGEHPLAYWYRVWGGYLPGVYVQHTRYRLNKPYDDIFECGNLAEITVPYTEAYTFSEYQGWKKKYRLYYETTHWITGVKTGPDEKPWYELTSQLSTSLVYYVRREHLRLVQDIEYLPTSIHVPPIDKHILISLEDQTLSAFEIDKLVFKTRISSGLGYKEVNLKNPNATATPRGTFNVTSKYPSKHMGGLIATGAPGSYTLPGVPWTTFFIFETGVAFHGTYWHNNFGSPMSHGCINMRNSDAKWVFRWVNPAYDPPYKNHCDWYNTGHGTRIVID